MKKMSLNLDALRVDSFTTVASAGARGTVGAHQYTPACSYGCSTECEDTVTFGTSCACTTEFPSGGQNNCTTLIEN